ncbi:MAG TPA: DUF427 domain-containing protein [Thermoleophilaceae bacterium]|jgi:uncharacterized protein (DUF427 family)
MALTVGRGPFGHTPAGTFNRELPPLKGLIYFEDFPRRIRARFAGETVVDSCRAKLLHEHGLLPILYFPEDEVRTDLFEPSDHATHCPWKGDARHHTLRVGDSVAKDAAWSYPAPLEGAAGLAGHVAFYWDRVDGWLEEDEPLMVHMRDPYHRTDVLDTSRHVRVEIGGETVAESTRARALFETGLPPRWYLPREDVRDDALVPSDTRTGCAYKGYALYHSVRVGETEERDVVWYYPEPLRDAERIRDRLCFLNEVVDLYLDGELQERPVSPFSRRD